MNMKNSKRIIIQINYLLWYVTMAEKDRANILKHIRLACEYNHFLNLKKKGHYPYIYFHRQITKVKLTHFKNLKFIKTRVILWQKQFFAN